jgi:hypothetical protein
MNAPDSTIYPAELHRWAGNQAGGVRRLFDEASGRPMQEVLRTQLLSRLESWADSIKTNITEAPRIVLLVGGPGNGKTEAIESSIKWLDEAFNSGGQLSDALRSQLFLEQGQPVPRVATAQSTHPDVESTPIRVSIVQDASVEPGPEDSRAALFADELEAALTNTNEVCLYLACVNRGVLDDAMILCSEQGKSAVRPLLQAIINAVGVGGGQSSCWPLQDWPNVVVWPMDVESLVAEGKDGFIGPALEILNKALLEANWPTHGSCIAKQYCPFCSSRNVLASNRGRVELIQMLRWHEMAAAKRWTFRDLFTLISYLLSGTQEISKSGQTPCTWAASLLEQDKARLGQKPSEKKSSAIFTLALAQYQHLLFSSWDTRAVRRMREDFKDLNLSTDHTAVGLLGFLKQGHAIRPPAMIEGLLAGVCKALDPALADPLDVIALSGSTSIQIRELDSRFSQSVSAGRDLVRKHKAVSPAELELLGRLAELDRLLADPVHRKRRPDAASRVQHIIRDFACKLVRRSLGSRNAVTQDRHLLQRYQAIIDSEGDEDEPLLAAAKDVSRLLNTNDKFEVSLTTTFGQPMPPAGLRAALVTARQHVKPRADQSGGRPVSPIRSLRIGKGQGEQILTLTFELYRAMRLIDSGLSRASLPAEVNALIDSTKARLSGPIVRDADGLEDSYIELLSAGARIEILNGRFRLGTGDNT